MRLRYASARTATASSCSSRQTSARWRKTCRRRRQDISSACRDCDLACVCLYGGGTNVSQTASHSGAQCCLVDDEDVRCTTAAASGSDFTFAIAVPQASIAAFAKLGGLAAAEERLAAAQEAGARLAALAERAELLQSRCANTATQFLIVLACWF